MLYHLFIFGAEKFFNLHRLHSGNLIDFSRRKISSYFMATKANIEPTPPVSTLFS